MHSSCGSLRKKHYNLPLIVFLLCHSLSSETEVDTMTQECAWNLFFATGLPQAYLAVCAARTQEAPHSAASWETARTAFSFRAPPQRPV